LAPFQRRIPDLSIVNVAIVILLLVLFSGTIGVLWWQCLGESRQNWPRSSNSVYVTKIP
jgi:hypothetical protein